MEKKILTMFLSLVLVVSLVMPSIIVNAEPNDYSIDDSDYQQDYGEDESDGDYYNEGITQDKIDKNLYDGSLIKVILYTVGKDENDSLTYTDLQSISKIDIEELQKSYNDIENITINDFSLLKEIPNLQELNLSNAIWINLNGIEQLQSLKILKINGCTFQLEPLEISFSTLFLERLAIENDTSVDLSLNKRILKIKLDDVSISRDNKGFDIPLIMELKPIEELSDDDKLNALTYEIIADEGEWSINNFRVELNSENLEKSQIPMEIKLINNSIKAIITTNIFVDSSLNKGDEYEEESVVEEDPIEETTVEKVPEVVTENESDQSSEEVPTESQVINEAESIPEEAQDVDNSELEEVQPQLDLPTIVADDKTINVGDTFDPLDGVKVIDKNNEEVNIDIEVKENQVNTNEPGKYGITYSIIYEENEITKSIVVTVKKDDNEINASPIINAESKVIDLGSTFKPLEGVTAFDEEDGDITDRLIYLPHTVDTNYPGVYLITYEVTDSKGATTRKSVEITVVKPIEEENEAPVINASDRTIKVGTKFNPLEGVTAFDKEDGELTGKIKVVENMVDINYIGKYYITYEVTDSGGKTTSKSINVKVEQQAIPVNKAPTIYAENKTIKAESKFNPYSGVTASDYEDGDLTGKVKVIYNNLNTNVAGLYRIVYEVTDSAGYRVTKGIYVNVVPKENNRPIIYVTDVIVPLGGKYDPYAMVTSHDKEDGNITGKVVVVYNYVNVYKEGTYKVGYKVTDSMGLSASCVVKVTVKNYGKAETNEEPVLYANNISIAVDSSFNPLEWVAAIDKEDGDITNRVMVISNEVDTSKEGNYHVTYEVIDSSGNKANTVMMVYVKKEKDVLEQNQPPVIYAENITVDTGTYFNPMDGVTALDEEDGNLNHKIIIVENDVDVSKKGTYKVTYEVTDSMDKTTSKTINVTVVGNSGLLFSSNFIILIVAAIAVIVVIIIGIVAVVNRSKK